MAGFETNLTKGIGLLLADAGHGTWSDTGSYTAAQTGILVKAFPQSPDRLITLSTYGVSDDPTLSDDEVGLQVRTRWATADPRLVDDLADGVFDTLHGLEWVQLATGLLVEKCFRRSWVSLGQDTNQRWARSDNYYLTVHRPSTNRS